ncbi:uncharacterized protein LOC143854455 [Tasmannia lanceolata]|uniref:uncharacterized protein LOC143854455 n=1 Tax=Tasmannia lanceolata TaxID=3420 RepID=UPI0040640718
MVVKMMRWSPWPPQATTTKRFQVKAKILRIEGFEGDEGKVLMADMIWKGHKSGGLVSLRKREKQERRNVSIGRLVLGEDGGRFVEFGDEFENVCGFSVLHKDHSFNAWDVSISILYGPEAEELSAIGTVSINLAEIALEVQKDETGSEIQRKLAIPLHVAAVVSDALLYISFSFIEIRILHGSPESIEEDSFLRRVTSYVSSSRRMKKKKSPGDETDNGSYGSVSERFTADEDESDLCETEDSPDDELGPTQPNQLGYSSIASAANRILAETVEETSVYYASRGSNSSVETSSVTQLASSLRSEARSELPPKGGFLSWKKRRLSFRSGKRKEEPLIKKGNCDEGGDDIDMIRRQLSSSSDESASSTAKNGEVTLPEKQWPESDFGEEDFKVGSWEEKELISRDGQVKLKACVFSASIDQRSESAAGAGACTALVAVIADWLQSNQGAMPTRSELDSLIREGSLEWRKLCENKAYRDLFPDNHFDLETVLQARIRPITVIPEKSFIGFFEPESFEFLHGAMSFDQIWDEIMNNVGDVEPRVYIVSWNDHFFLLKTDADACYIIDTLGERLFEGCNQAYILKFDNEARMYNSLEKETDGQSEDLTKEKVGKGVGMVIGGEDKGDKGNGELICSGRECCREFIKRFLAAIPLRELEMEVKKGTVSNILLHHRLQIEFHYSTPSRASMTETIDDN